jgi:hypothetical protein
MTPRAQVPGVRFVVAPASPAPTALRTDIAAFVGRARRGPIGEAVRIEGWREYERIFGGNWREASSPYALRGYFDNGGEIAYFTRLGDAAATTAIGVWEIARTAGDPLPALAGFHARSYRLHASSPGTWANGMIVEITYRRSGVRGPTVDMVITPRDQPVERLLGLQPNQTSVGGLPATDDPFVTQLAERSMYLRAEPLAPTVAVPPGSPPGPALRVWSRASTRRDDFLPAITLDGGSESAISVQMYLDAISLLADAPEPALLVLPDLQSDPATPLQRNQIIVAATQSFDAERDRMVVADLPASIVLPEEAAQWVDALGQDEAIGRTLVAYHPWLRINDPLGGVLEPQRVVPPSGHVAGVMSRIDRERGAYVTPANVSIDSVLDVSVEIDDEASAAIYDLGVNALRCATGRGVQVWGARMLRSGADEQRFVAHRRLMHRLVRAIRRVARPLVFENNGPILWLSLSRAATGILLEAFRAGALKGARPEQAFRVRCDEELNPSEARDQGRVVCEVSFAPAVPMEFITLRVALSADGSLEVAEP